MKLFSSSATRYRRLIATAVCMLIMPALFFPHPMAAAPPADNETIVGFGHSPIRGDQSGAKKRAVSRALLNTVQTAALRMIPISDLTGHFELITTVTDRHRDAFVQDYRILKEFHTDETYSVLVEATVSTRGIEKALADAGFDLTPTDLPAVLLMVAEKNIDDLGFNYWWKRGYADFSGAITEPVIRQVFSEAGFKLISPAPNSDVLDEEILASGMDAEPADYQAALLAERMGADLVVVGRAEAEALSNKMGQNVRTFRAVVRLHVLEAETGEKLTSVSERAVNVSEDPEKGSKNALADAAHAAVTQLSQQTISLWRNIDQSKAKFEIRIQGKRILPHLERLRRAIAQHPGVSNLQTTEMAPENAVLEMEYTESAQKLGNHLLMQSFDGFGINILEISPRAMDIELISG